MKQIKELSLSILIILCLTTNVRVSAKTIKEIWTSLPDSMIVYLDKDTRAECINLLEMNMKPEVTNKLGGKTRIDTLTSNFISVALTESSNMQIRLLPTQSDTILCVVHTFCAPPSESSIALYTQDWEKISDIVFNIDSLTIKPDTMEQSEYEKIKRYMDPFLITARLLPESEDIIVSPSVANIASDDREKINGILLQRKFKWNGNSFN